jgi:hypothetical protein
MKYMLMMNTMKSNQDPFPGWSQEDVKRHIDFMIATYQELKGSGELAMAEGLALPAEAKQVKASKEGKILIDGAFAETKEFLAGFWIVTVPTPERAYEIAAKISAAPGAAGEPMGMAIEVRQVMSGPPEL